MNSCDFGGGPHHVVEHVLVYRQHGRNYAFVVLWLQNDAKI